MKRFEIEYKDCIGMKCMVNDVLSVSEKEAVIKLQLELIGDNDIMTELIYVEVAARERSTARTPGQN